MSQPGLFRASVSEAVGTFILAMFGLGSLHTAILTSAQVGIGQVAAVWGIGVALAIFATGAVGGAHLNPAITIAFAVFRGFPRPRILPYIASQLFGAIAAAALLYAMYGGAISRFEAAHGIQRGQANSEKSAMIYAEYFPNPTSPAGNESLGLGGAMLGEAVGTALLAFFIFAVTDARNRGRPGGNLAPLFIGLALAIIISIEGPLTQAGLNPARDFGPRLFAYFAGWGSIAIPGPRGGFFTVYVLAPILGALAGAAVYDFLLRPAMPVEISKGE